MRPALLLLSASYAGRKDRSAIRLAAVVELLHSATLIHDDVIDSADTRRGRPSANSKWGNHCSVLTGDWLYMQSFQMALEERNFRILDILIDLTQKMVEGELIQLAKIGSIDVTEEDALRLATYKTARALAPCLAVSRVKKSRRSQITGDTRAWRFNSSTICWILRRPRNNSANRSSAT